MVRGTRLLLALCVQSSLVYVRGAYLWYSAVPNKPWPCPNGVAFPLNATTNLNDDPRVQTCKTVNGVFSCTNDLLTNVIAPYVGTRPWMPTLYKKNRPACDPTKTSPKEFHSASYTLSWPFLGYGLQDWSNNEYNRTGKVMLIDCISLKCTGSASGRQLGHSGAVSIGTAQPGWLPDPAAPATDYCDISTMVTSAVTSAEDLIATVGYLWWFQCVILKRSGSSVATFQSAGFKGLTVFLGTLMVQNHAVGGRVGESNPAPDFPIVFVHQKKFYGAAQCNLRKALSPIDSSTANDACNPGAVAWWWTPERADDGALLTELWLQFNKAPSAEIHITMTSDPNPFRDAMMAPGNQFLFVSYGILTVVLMLYSFYSIWQLRSILFAKRWTIAVIVLEGIIAGAIRAWRHFSSPILYKEMGSVDVSAWLLHHSDTPFSTASTWITAATWLRILYGRTLSQKAEKCFDVVNLFIVFVILVGLIILSLIFPYNPWWGWVDVAKVNLWQVFSEPNFAYLALFITIFL